VHSALGLRDNPSSRARSALQEKSVKIRAGVACRARPARFRDILNDHPLAAWRALGENDHLARAARFRENPSSLARSAL
jgi:hypothetical protein